MADPFVRSYRPRRNVCVTFEGFPVTPGGDAPADRCRWRIELTPRGKPTQIFTILGRVTGVDTDSDAICIDVDELPIGIMPAVRNTLDVNSDDAGGFLTAWVNEGPNREFDLWYYNHAEALGLPFSPDVAEFLGSYSSGSGKPGAFQVFVKDKNRRP